MADKAAHSRTKKKKKERIRIKEIMNPTENESWGGNKDPHQKQAYLWLQFKNI